MACAIRDISSQTWCQTTPRPQPDYRVPHSPANEPGTQQKKPQKRDSPSTNLEKCVGSKPQVEQIPIRTSTSLGSEAPPLRGQTRRIAGRGRVATASCWALTPAKLTETVPEMGTEPREELAQRPRPKASCRKGPQIMSCSHGFRSTAKSNWISEPMFLVDFAAFE